MSDPTPQPKGNRGTTGEPYYMATDYNHIDGGHKISSNHPQEWEREFDELWSMDGIPPTDEKQEVEHLAYQVQKTKSFIRSVVEKAVREERETHQRDGEHTWKMLIAQDFCDHCKSVRTLHEGKWLVTPVSTNPKL